MPRETSILFVCTGNICRSPTAEAVAKALAQKAEKNLVLDSAGTGDWHVGERPDPRAVQFVGDRARMIAESLLTGIAVQRDGIGGAIERKDLPHV